MAAPTYSSFDGRYSRLPATPCAPEQSEMTRVHRVQKNRRQHPFVNRELENKLENIGRQLGNSHFEQSIIDCQTQRVCREFCYICCRDPNEEESEGCDMTTAIGCWNLISPASLVPVCYFYGFKSTEVVIGYSAFGGQFCLTSICPVFALAMCYGFRRCRLNCAARTLANEQMQFFNTFNKFLNQDVRNIIVNYLSIREHSVDKPIKELINSSPNDLSATCCGNSTRKRLRSIFYQKLAPYLAEIP